LTHHSGFDSVVTERNSTDGKEYRIFSASSQVHQSSYGVRLVPAFQKSQSNKLIIKLFEGGVHKISSLLRVETGKVVT